MVILVVTGTNKQAVKAFVNWIKDRKLWGVIVINETSEKGEDGIYRVVETEIKLIRKDMLHTGHYIEIAEIETELWEDNFEHHILALTGEDKNEYISYGLLEKLIESNL